MSNDAEEVNPYEAPKAKEKAKPEKRAKKKQPSESAEDGFARDRVVYAFQATRGWMTFFGVLSYIGAALLALFGMYTVFASSALTRSFEAAGPVAFIVYLIIAVLYVIIGTKMFGYREGIDRVLAEEGSMDSIAIAVERQRDFWSFVGRVAVVSMVLYGIFFLGVMMFAFAR
jgi:hypothetical protein